MLSRAVSTIWHCRRGALDPQQRFMRKDNSSLGHRVHLTLEGDWPQVFQELAGEEKSPVWASEFSR